MDAINDPFSKGLTCNDNADDVEKQVGACCSMIVVTNVCI